MGFAVGCYSLACLAIMRWWMVRRGVWRSIALGGLAVALLLALSLVADVSASQQNQMYPVAVIAEDGVWLRKGNGLAYPPRGSTALNRGVEARVVGSRGGWCQIELAEGEVGWVPAEKILVD
jgi:uncharacterized protein YgiM (DUF1202 family)